MTGNDRGNDRLAGSGGAGQFIYGSVTESQDDHVDRITDFTGAGVSGGGHIDLSLLDASPEAGQQHLAFSGTAQTARGVWVSYDPASDMTLVFSNTDDTGTANLRIRLTGEQQFSPATSSP